MRPIHKTASIIDMAHEVLRMNRTIETQAREIEHLNTLLEMYREDEAMRGESHDRFIGMAIVGAMGLDVKEYFPAPDRAEGV